MHYIVESLFVGIYCSIIYSIIIPFFDEYYMVLFIVGVLKHFLGLELYLHTLYCKYGDACERSKPATNYVAKKISVKQRIFECLLEGTAFLVIGYIFSFFTNDRIMTIFLIGFIIHIIAEQIGIHKQFCKKRCVKGPTIRLFEPLIFHETRF